MTLEAMNRYGWPAAGIVRRLRRHPGEIRQLVLFRQALDEFPRFGVQVLMITPQLLWSARQLPLQRTVHPKCLTVGKRATNMRLPAAGSAGATTAAPPHRRLTAI